MKKSKLGQVSNAIGFSKEELDEYLKLRSIMDILSPEEFESKECSSLALDIAEFNVRSNFQRFKISTFLSAHQNTSLFSGYLGDISLRYVKKEFSGCSEELKYLLNNEVTSKCWPFLAYCSLIGFLLILLWVSSMGNTAALTSGFSIIGLVFLIVVLNLLPITFQWSKKKKLLDTEFNRFFEKDPYYKNYITVWNKMLQGTFDEHIAEVDGLKEEIKQRLDALYFTRIELRSSEEDYDDLMAELETAESETQKSSEEADSLRLKVEDSRQFMLDKVKLLQGYVEESKKIVLKMESEENLVKRARELLGKSEETLTNWERKKIELSEKIASVVSHFEEDLLHKLDFEIAKRDLDLID